MYLVKTPKWLPHLLPRNLVWRMPLSEVPAVYLSFDDGPHPMATPFVLDELKKYNAQGTFFCIGKNVIAEPGIFKRIQAEGHQVGNHTHNHLNGWKSTNGDYLTNVAEANKEIGSKLFRPPYGRISNEQARNLAAAPEAYHIIMWDILSADFDTSISPQKCLDHVLKHLKPGAIVVFHDSAKAFERLSYALPRVLDYCAAKGWLCLALREEVFK